MTENTQIDILDNDTNANLLEVGDLAVYGRADGRYPLALGRVISIDDDGRREMQDISTYNHISSVNYHINPRKDKLLQYKFLDNELDEICHLVSTQDIRSILDIPEKTWSTRKHNEDILGQTYTVGDIVIHTIKPLYNKVHLGQVIQIDSGRGELIISGSAYGRMINIHIPFNQACIVQLSLEDKNALMDAVEENMISFYMECMKR
jgi:hypothetical protein